MLIEAQWESEKTVGRKILDAILIILEKHKIMKNTDNYKIGQWVG